jgi:hypothetical protein
MFVKVDGKNTNLVVEGITDEVCTLRYSEDTMQKMKSSSAFEIVDDGEEDVGKKRKGDDKAKKVAAKKKKVDAKKKLGAKK